ncbi:toll-like receptor 13 [Patella vulgata]|uniref:toll-like receptor 13 n=1 Tax=Patella vulgata TaxID=6465 RepID=UPI00217F9BD5|nr:toll-like receptor 13 [Patella vulgata]
MEYSVISDFKRGLIIGCLIICALVVNIATLEREDFLFRCIKNTSCVCSTDKKNVNCSGLGLTSIPTLPNATIRLNMSGNSLTHLNKSTGNNVANLILLDISNNSISSVDEGYFSIFLHLQKLNVSKNPLTCQIINKSVNGISKSLTELDLMGMGWEDFPYSLMKSLTQTKLAVLVLKNNSIKSFNSSNTFRQLKHLRHLDLSINFIANLILSNAKNLKYLSLSSNDLTELPLCCSNGTALLPNLKYLFMDDNCISRLKMENINCLGELQLLNISSTRIHSIESNTFSKLTKLRTLTLEYTTSLYDTNTVKPYAFNSASLERLFIRFNSIDFDPVGAAKVFENCSQLRHLDLSGNMLGKLHNYHWDALLKNMPNLIYFDVSKSRMLYLPKSFQNRLKNVEYFHFENNDAVTMHNDYFVHFVNLNTLLLNGNKFSTVTKEMLPTEFTRHLKHLDLAFNPWECNCDLLWFITFAKRFTKAGKMYNFPKNYECAGRGVNITDVNINKRSCLIRQKTGLIIRCTCISMITLLLMVSVVYRLRWRLRYMIYILNYHRRKYLSSDNNSCSYHYDVYFSCSESDFDFVYNDIVVKLEETFNVYIPQRDAMPGSLKVKHTLEKMDRCKCVVVCLSDSYAQDQWCEFECCMAIERSVCEGPDSLIVIVLKEICSINMTKVIHKLIRTNEHMIWDDTGESNDGNWTRLIRQIRTERPRLIRNSVDIP